MMEVQKCLETPPEDHEWRCRRNVPWKVVPCSRLSAVMTWQPELNWWRILKNCK